VTRLKLEACSFFRIKKSKLEAWSSGDAGYLMRELLSVSGIPAQPEL